MLTLPDEYNTLFTHVRPFFSQRVWPLVLGIDETIERRRGDQIRAKGIYRDPVRSSKRHFVKASGLHWVSMMLLVHIPRAQRIWGLPFLTVLAPDRVRTYSLLIRRKLV